MNIFIGRLASETCEETLTELFSKFGNVVSCFIVRDKQSKRSRGYAYIIMPNKQEAVNAIKSMNNYALYGENMMVKKARPGEIRFIKEEEIINK